MGKFGKIINNIFFGIIILFSLFIILTSVSIFGTRMFVVKSGSMEPSIHTGSVVFDRTASDYNVGDVVTFTVPNSKDTVTHRITEMKIDANQSTFYMVKGDANNSVDPDPVSKGSVVGKVSFSLPYLGYLVAFIRTLPGLIAFIIIPATIIIYQELTNIKTEVSRIRKAKKLVVEEVERIEKGIVDEEKKIVTKLQDLSKESKK